MFSALAQITQWMDANNQWWVLKNIDICALNLQCCCRQISPWFKLKAYQMLEKFNLLLLGKSARITWNDVNDVVLNLSVVSNYKHSHCQKVTLQNLLDMQHTFQTLQRIVVQLCQYYKVLAWKYVHHWVKLAKALHLSMTNFMMNWWVVQETFRLL